MGRSTWQNIRATRQRIREAADAGKAVLLISTDLDELLELSDRIAVIDRGKVALDGPPAAVLSDSVALQTHSLRPPPITRLSALLAPHGFPHPILSVDQFAGAWQASTMNRAR